MNIPYLTPEGVYIAIEDLAKQGIPPFYMVDIPARCVWVLWVFVVAQEERVLWN